MFYNIRSNHINVSWQILLYAFNNSCWCIKVHQKIPAIKYKCVNPCILKQQCYCLGQTHANHIPTHMHSLIKWHCHLMEWAQAQRMPMASHTFLWPCPLHPHEDTNPKLFLVTKNPGTSHTVRDKKNSGKIYGSSKTTFFSPWKRLKCSSYWSIIWWKHLSQSSNFPSDLMHLEGIGKAISDNPQTSGGLRTARDPPKTILSALRTDKKTEQSYLKSGPDQECNTPPLRLDQNSWATHGLLMGYPQGSLASKGSLLTDNPKEVLLSSWQI